MKLLRIDCSPMGEAAISRRLTAEFVRHWRAANPGGEVIERDLTATSIPPIDAAWVSAMYTPADARTPEQRALVKLSMQLIAELLDADEYAIGMPMHNWGPPACFKLWVDRIVTPSSTAEKPLAGKRTTFIVAAGRLYESGSPDAARNHLIPWLRSIFGLLGSTDMQFVFADGTRAISSGKIGHAEFLAPHLEAVRALFRTRRDAA